MTPQLFKDGDFAFDTKASLLLSIFPTENADLQKNLCNEQKPL